MTWEYILIGLVFGILIGVILMHFSNPKPYHQQMLKNELEKSKNELAQYRQELVGHFAHSAELLENMNNNYRQIYDHMMTSSKNLLPGTPQQNNPFRYRLNSIENDQLPIEFPPRDYSEGSSGILQAEHSNK
ncbi:Z-ring associated protein ZapG [Candidatus Profftia sp. (ex Adelges kitamiensis)]|uniref:Z-ring associated protein ZapG n=1 Tax=Candidatus Profftia sp. (ex Adelges kitamiensis) TaxID=2864218 RepID=UPI001CE2C531|nr:Z-ring associated protein ZapG [Candidatus Profftia sp. (ex Adelges kitamiensis)]